MVALVVALPVVVVVVEVLGGGVFCLVLFLK